MRWLLPLLLLSACGGKFSSYVEDGLIGGDAAKKTGRDGLVEFRFEVMEGDTSVLFTATVDDPWRVYVHALEDPEGNVLYDRAAVVADTQHRLTNATQAESSATLSWPILDEHEPLMPGKYTATVGAIDSEAYFVRNVEVEAHLLTKRDDTPDGGTLAVNIVYVNDTAETNDWQSATEDAVEVWRQLYEGLGIELDVEYYEAEADFLRIPGDGTLDEYRDISASTPLRSVNLVLVDEIDLAQGLYGITGGIPGPLVSTGHSAIAVSMLVNAGRDARYDDDERRLLGETMGHEVGHFLGLFHPVESTWEHWDLIADTVECTSEDECIDALGENLMFSYPLCDINLENCAPQFEFTPDQAGSANRYAGVD